MFVSWYSFIQFKLSNIGNTKGMKLSVQIREVTIHTVFTFVYKGFGILSNGPNQSFYLLWH